MTPQERARVADLFDRLARLERAPREQEAEDAIDVGLRQAPNAPYAMVQTILLLEEALERANERIGELEAAGTDAPAETGGFLDTLRGALSGQPAAPRRGSVPSTRGGPMGVPPGFRSAGPADTGRQPIGQGGSFLGQAASIAAGVVVGSMVADALRGQFGSEAGKPAGQEPDASAQQTSFEDDPAQDDGDYESADFDGGDGFDLGGGDFA